MNKLDEQYQSLLQDILDNGVVKLDRTGTGTRSVFGRQIRHKMSEGFPLLTTKKMAWKSIVTELLWFLRGDTNIKYLVDNDCHIWDGDAYEGYTKQCVIDEVEPMPRELFLNAIKNNKFTEPHFIPNRTSYVLGDLGPVYGVQWRRWKGRAWTPRAWLDENGKMVVRNNNNIKVDYSSIDQIANLITDLKNNPDSRRLMVTAWNPADVPNSVLPPCHYGFQVWTRELSQSERFNWYGNKIGSHMHHDRIEQEMDEWGVPKRAISLMWNQRSVDTFLGLPFNIASYGLLLEIIAKEVNMVPDELIGNLGDVHLYSNHIAQAEEQLSRTPFPLPTLRINKYRSDTYTILFDTDKWSHTDFTIENYQSHPAIKAPLSN
jgi:thymidylate synthase